MDLTLENSLHMSSVSQKNLLGHMTLDDFAYLGGTFVKLNTAFTGGGKEQEDKVCAAFAKEFTKALSKLYSSDLLQNEVDVNFERVTG